MTQNPWGQGRSAESPFPSTQPATQENCTASAMSRSTTTTSTLYGRRQKWRSAITKQAFLLPSAVSRDWEEPFLKLPVFKDTSILLPNKDPEIDTIVGKVLEFLQQVRSICFLPRSH